MANEMKNEENIVLTGTVVTREELALDQKKMDRLDSSKMVGIMDEIYTKAINGIPKISRSVDEIAAEYMNRYNDAKTAARELSRYQIAKCGTTGFITGLGGLITLPVAIPANVGRVIYVQIRMIAAIARIGGFDIHSDQVQTLVYTCLTGNAISDVIKQTGIRMGEKLSESVIARIPAKVLTMVNQKVGFKLIAQFGSEGAINLMEFVPVAGGVIGGAIDIASTRIIANNAITVFIDKKIPEERKSFKEVAMPVTKKGTEMLGKAKDSVGKGINTVSSTVKNKYDETINEMKTVKMPVREVSSGKLEQGKMCHVITSPRRILLSWDYFTDENGNRYMIEKSMTMPSKQKKNAYEYYVDFEDQSIELPKGTVLFAGEDKWRKKLPDSDINSMVYCAFYTSMPLPENETLENQPADITIKLSKDGMLFVERKSAASSLKYSLGKKAARKFFEDLKNCISSGESRPFETGDAFGRLLTLQFENGEEISYQDVRGYENGKTTKDIIYGLIKAQGVNCAL